MTFSFTHQEWLALMFAATTAKGAIPLGSWGKKLETAIEAIVHEAVKLGYHHNESRFTANLDAADTRTLYKVADNVGSVIEGSQFSRPTNKAMIFALNNLPKLNPERRCHNCNKIISLIGPSRCKKCLDKQKLQR